MSQYQLGFNCWLTDLPTPALVNQQTKPTSTTSTTMSLPPITEAEMSRARSEYSTLSGRRKVSLVKVTLSERIRVTLAADERAFKLAEIRENAIFEKLARVINTPKITQDPGTTKCS